jgi:hypothetical protein
METGVAEVGVERFVCENEKRGVAYDAKGNKKTALLRGFLLFEH